MTDDAASQNAEHEDIDLELARRLRAALRGVSPQEFEAAEQARTRALAQARRPRRVQLWMTTAAAVVVGLLGAVIIIGSDDRSDEVADSGLTVLAPDTASTSEMRSAASGTESTFDIEGLDLVSLRTLVRSAPAREPICTPQGDEVSYGQFEFADTSVEVHADLEAGVVRLLDPMTCETLALTDVGP